MAVEIVAELPLIITFKNGLPTIEIRRSFSDPETIRKLVSAAYHGQPIVILPSFRNKLQALAALQEKGIVYLDPETKEYTFNI